MILLFELFLHEKQQNMNLASIGGMYMRDEYDFSKSVQNPYNKKLRKQITINLDVDVIDYFKAEAQRTGIPYLREQPARLFLAGWFGRKLL